jgi:hypothetical protein
MFHIHTCIENTSAISTSFSLVPYPPSTSVLPNTTCSTFLSFIVSILSTVQRGLVLVCYLYVHCTLFSLTLSSTFPPARDILFSDPVTSLGFSDEADPRIRLLVTVTGEGHVWIP